MAQQEENIMKSEAAGSTDTSDSERAYFHAEMAEILRRLDTRHGQFTDADLEDKTLEREDNVEAYDRIERLRRNAGDDMNSVLVRAQDKIREAYLILKDLDDGIKQYE